MERSRSSDEACTLKSNYERRPRTPPRGFPGRHVKRVAHLLWRSQGGIRRHVKTLAQHPPCGWTTAGIWGPPELAEYFASLDFHPMRVPGTGDLDAVDVVHAHGVTAGLVGVRRRRPPVVLSLHVVVGGSGRTARSTSARVAARLIASRADAVVAVSEAAARGFPRARVIAPVFDPLPRPSRDRGSVRRDLGASVDDTVVVTVSRLEATKRLDLFVTAIEAAGCTGWIVGDGPDRVRLEALARGSRTQLLGYRDDVSDLLAAADVFALPSVSESYGIAVAEAVAAGLPVVATRTGAIDEIVGASGIIVSAGDDEAFVAAVRALANDQAERQRRASLARERARPDRSALVGALGQVYDDVLRSKARG